MTFIFYSSVAVPGRYIDGKGNHVVIKWKAHDDAENPLKAASEALFPDEPPPPPQKPKVESEFTLYPQERIANALETIAEAVEGIYELLNRK